MSHGMKVRVLGAGTSSGVPRIGNDWGACDPAEPRNRRMRASILVESATTRVLIDTGPDMREQLLAAGIDHVDAVLWTHEHADHCHGIDDLRQVMHARGSAIPGHARTPTMEALRQRFSYIFEGRGGYPPVVEARILPDALTIGDRNYISVVEAGSLIFLTFYQGVRVGFELLMSGDAPTADETELLTEFVGAVAFL